MPKKSTTDNTWKYKNVIKLFWPQLTSANPGRNSFDKPKIEHKN